MNGLQHELLDHCYFSKGGKEVSRIKTGIRIMKCSSLNGKDHFFP